MVIYFNIIGTGKLKENLDTRFTLCEEAEGRPISYSVNI